MSIMNRNTQILLIAILAIVVSSCTFSRTRSPVEEMVRNKKKRADILSELIQSNRLTGLPSEFVIGDSPRIACSQILNESDESFTLAAVNYDVHKVGRGSRTHIFVFNSSGECIFHSPDDTPAVTNDNFPYDMLFCDMTGDRNIEKVVTFDLYEAGKTTDSFQPLRNAMQIWRLSNDSSELLLEVHYSIWDTERKRIIFPRLSWPMSEGAPPIVHVGEGIPDITLGEFKRKPLVVFRWSPESLSFSSQPESSDRWKVEYTVSQQQRGADGE